MNFIQTSKTASVSLTGKNCELNCSHCGKKFLKGMIPIDDININKLKNKGITSLLISGGMNSADFQIPIYENVSKLKKLKEAGFLLNFHTGLIDTSDQLFDDFINIADKISFDLHLNNDILRNIYKMKKVNVNYVKKVFEKIYNELLINNMQDKLVPHICIGLNYGKIGFEYEVLDYLKKFEKISKIILILFLRKKGTEMENVALPEIDDIKNVFKYSVNNFVPAKKIVLGCMRTFKGEYAKMIEKSAIECGIKTIVNPKNIDFSPSDLEKGQCCAF